ncbi:MAG: amidase [Chloroflexi bacterium]|nr:amidase [Chloroflexota bacterium]
MSIPRCPGCGGSRQAFHDEDVNGKPVTFHDDNGCELCDEQGRSWGGVLVGDVLERLAGLAPRSVSCVVTSPPYWSLRKYDAPDVVWGGDPNCEHEWMSTSKNGAVEAYEGAGRWQHADHSRDETPGDWGRVTQGSGSCRKCGAFLGQYGLEPTPELYVEHTLDVLRAIRRVLRPDGIVWWNIGDGYAGGGRGDRPQDSSKQATNAGSLNIPPTRGIVGLKPTFGRISRLGVIPHAQSFDHVGVLTRTVADAAAVLDVLAGHDAADPDSAAEPVDAYSAALGTGGPPRIGLVRTWFADLSDAETRLKMEDVAQELARAGAEVHEVDPGIDFGEAYAHHRVMMETETAATHAELFPGNEHLYGPKLTDYIRRGQAHAATAYVAAAAFRRRMQALARAAFERVDVLLMPTASGPAPRDLTSTGDTRFQSAWSYTGFPSITVPVGLASNGLPLGMQLAGAPFEEAKLLRVAHWAEQALGVRLSPPV